MPSVAESCLKFRQETLAPSGGWLASVAIGISLKTGIFEYTILGIIFIISYVILRTSSCETAMVLALAYDLVIPLQYQNFQRHLAELEKYWPKFMIATAIEFGCYLLLQPDLFNLAVIIKTSLLLILWMKGKKQFPLNLNKNGLQAPQQPQSQAQTGQSEAFPTKEYLSFVYGELGKLNGDMAVDKAKAQLILQQLMQSPESEQGAHGRRSIQARNIPSFETWLAGGAGGGGGQGQRQPPQQVNHTTGAPQQSSAHGGGTQSKTQAQGSKQKFNPPTPAEIEQLRLDMKSHGCTLPPDDIIGSLVKGPTDPGFQFGITYLRSKGISTRKWIPIVPDKTTYQFPEAVIEKATPIIKKHFEQTGDREGFNLAYNRLRKSAITMADFKERVGKINAAVPNLNLVVTGSEGDYQEKVNPMGGEVHDYYDRLREARRQEGQEAAEKLEAAYDLLCDPANNPGRKEVQADDQLKRWIEGAKNTWNGYATSGNKEYSDAVTGKAGLSQEIIKEYRDEIERLGYGNNLQDAMIYMIKNESSPETAKQRFDYIMAHSSSTKDMAEVIELYKDHTADAKEYKRINEEADKVEAARKAADATGQGPTWD